MNKPDDKRYKIAIDNRRARFEFEVLEEFETGIVLKGTEVKTIRSGRASMVDCFADIGDYEKTGTAVYLLNMYIPPYEKSNKAFQHETHRPRKLLLHKSQVQKLLGKVKQKGLTLIPLRLYFNEKGRAKIMLALCKGKNVRDKRETTKDREWNRQKQRELKG